MIGGLGEAARIFITVGINTAAAAQGLQSVSKEMDSFGAKVGTWSKTMGGALAGPLDAFGRIGDAADGVTSVARAVGGLAQTLFSGAARNEQYAVSFGVLLGSTEKATEHINKLKEFATETPFTLPGIVETSKQLEVMGGGTLNTIENLRLVGDVASGTGQEIDRVGLQFGRLYDGLKNGTPLGEVMMRLSEMGAISGDSKRKILALSEAVQSGAMTMDDAWATATNEFGRFAGLTGKQSQTLAGLWSTFTDTIDEGFAKIGTKLLPMVKPVLKGAIDLFGKLADAAIFVMDNFEYFAPLVMAVVIPAVAALTIWMGGLAVAVIAATWPFLAIGAAAAGIIFALSNLGGIVQFVVDKFNEFGPAIALVLGPLGVLPAILGVVGGALGVFGEKAETTAQVAATSMENLPGKMADDLYEGVPVIAAAAAALVLPIKEKTEQTAVEAWMAVRDMSNNIMASLRGDRENLTAAATVFADAMTQPLIVAGKLAGINQQLADKDLVARLHNKSKVVQTIAQGEQAALVAERMKTEALLATLGSDATQKARTEALIRSKALVTAQQSGNDEMIASADLFQAQLTSKLWGLHVAVEPPMTAAATAMSKALTGGWEGMRTAATEWGEDTGAAYAAGIESEWAAVRLAAKKLADAAAGPLKAHSPPGPQSPLHQIDVWGKRTGAAWVGGLSSTLSAAGRSLSSALGPVAAALSPSSGALRTAGAGGGAGGGGFQIDIHFSSVTPYTPAEQLELGNRIGPAAADWLRSHGYVD